MATTSSSISIFGIRHHGPGSARSLALALALQQPDVLLVEGPPDADALLSLATDPGMKPPVALLVYNPKNLRQASFFPFAEFSPEWQAITYGLQNHIPVRFMDLPMSLAFAMHPDEESAAQLTLELPEANATAGAPVADNNPHDPFTEIARLAGYSDPERWWEATFERWTGNGGPRGLGGGLETVAGDGREIKSDDNPASEENRGNTDVFAIILELMQVLREEKTKGGKGETGETILREAWMRQAIRLAEKEGFQRIAVVCGAWHAPALTKTPDVKASHDASLLKGLKKIKTKSTWIPWSFDRLATQSGYSAGVIAPAWYQMLWKTNYCPSSGPHPPSDAQRLHEGQLDAKGRPSSPLAAPDVQRLREGHEDNRQHSTSKRVPVQEMKQAVFEEGEEETGGALRTDTARQTEGVRQTEGGGQTEGGRAHTIWFSEAARLLRRHDLVLSSAHVIEAVRLSEALAALRNTLLPGTEELREAAVAVLCEGAEKPYEMVEQQLIIGDVLGTVPDSVPVVPLKADFEVQARSARLPVSTVEQNLSLDLREAAHLRKSLLLHRLQLLHIPWGKTGEVSGRKEGRFHENWAIKWLPDYEIRLIEAGGWGNTIETAATRRVGWEVKKSEQLPALVQLLGTVLKADLTGVLPPLLQKLRNVSAMSQDTLALAEAVLPMVEVLRYGQARQMNRPAIEQLLERMVPRVCIQLPGACQGVNEEIAGEIAKRIVAMHRALGLWQREEFGPPWQYALERIAGEGAPLLAGLSARLLFEQQALLPAETAALMQYRLSHAQPAYEAAQWLEGFLHGSGLLLLHQPVLWTILDQWVNGLSTEDFPELLPLLRRTFSRFTGPEREKMLNLAKNGNATFLPQASDAHEWQNERADQVWPLLHRIFEEEAKAGD